MVTEGVGSDVAKGVGAGVSGDTVGFLEGAGVTGFFVGACVTGDFDGVGVGASVTGLLLGESVGASVGVGSNRFSKARSLSSRGCPCFKKRDSEHLLICKALFKTLPVSFTW